VIKVSGPDRWAIPEYRSGPFRLVKTSKHAVADTNRRNAEDEQGHEVCAQDVSA
jgi:hypothetical protein